MKANAETSMKFLRKCRSNGIMPRFIKNSYKNHFDFSLNDMFSNFQKSLLNRLISQKYDLIKSSSNQIDSLLADFTATCCRRIMSRCTASH